MSQFELTEEQRAVYDNAFHFAQKELAPLQARMDDEDWFPSALMPLLGSNGYLGVTAPAAYGGAEMDLFSCGMVAEAFGYWNHNAAMIWGPHENLCLNNILRNGNEAQRQRFLPKMIFGRFQLVQGMLAEMYADVEAARSMAYRILMACNDLERGGGGRGDIHKLCAASILTVSEMAIRVADKSVQIHGGSGFIWETEVNRAYRNVRIGPIGGGTQEVRKLIIAAELMRGHL